MHKTDINNPTGHLSIKNRLGIAVLSALFIASLAVFGVGHQSVSADTTCSSSTVSAGTYVTSVTLAKSGTYTVWAHMKASSNSANLLLLGINGTCYPLGDSGSIPANTWTWVNYYGTSSNAIQRAFVQGAQNIMIEGASLGVKVDKIELLSDACTPTGDGSNCASTSQAGGSYYEGTAVSISTAPNNSGDIRIFGSGGILVPANTTVPTEISSPSVTVDSTTYDGISDPLKSVSYYLNDKLLATASSQPFSYKLDIKHTLNGTYTLMTKMTYTSGKIATTSQQLVIKNPISPEQILLQAEHYIVYEVIVVLVLIIGIALLRKPRKAQRR